MQRWPRQVVPVKKASPVALIAAITSSVRLSWSSSVAPGPSVVEAHQPLVDLGDADGARVGQSADPGHDGVSVTAAAGDEIGQTGASQLPERSPGGKASRPAGMVRGPVELVAYVGRMHEIARVVLHRGAMILRMGHEGVTAVVRHVEPLVPVGRPRVGQLGPAKEVAQLRHRVAPEAHGAIDVHPRAGFVREGDQLGEGIEGAAVHVARLEHHDRGPLRLPVQRIPQRVRRELPGGIARQDDDVGDPDAEELCRAGGGAVHFIRGEEPDPGCAGQAFAVDVPSGSRKHRMPRRGQAGDVGHLAAGHQRKRGRRGEAEHVLEPGAADLFDHGGRGTTGVEAGVLVPGCGEPIGSEGGGEAGPDHPAVEAAPGAAQEAAGGAAGQLVDDADGIGALVRQRARKAAPQLGERRGGAHRRVVQ